MHHAFPFGRTPIYKERKEIIERGRISPMANFYSGVLIFFVLLISLWTVTPVLSHSELDYGRRYENNILLNLKHMHIMWAYYDTYLNVNPIHACTKKSDCILLVPIIFTHLYLFYLGRRMRKRQMMAMI